MKEVAMSLEEIETNFGKSIAEECSKMENGKTEEFSTATYEGIVVRCVRGWLNTYYVEGELICEEALELGLDDEMEMDM